MARRTTKTAQVEAPVTEQVEKTFDIPALMSEFKTKAAVIRHLDGKGQTRGQIAKLMGIRYQHVRNTLITPIGKKA